MAYRPLSSKMVNVPLVDWRVTHVTITVDGEEEQMGLEEFYVKLAKAKSLPPDHPYWADKSAEFVAKMDARTKALFDAEAALTAAKNAYEHLPAHLATIGSEAARLKTEGK